VSLKSQLTDSRDFVDGEIDCFIAKEIINLIKLGDNSKIVCIDSCKDTLYILANNHGLSTPEAFGVLVCRHFLTTYKNNIAKFSVCIEDFSWDRMAYEEPNHQLHDHAFVHSTDCMRTCTVSMEQTGELFL